MFFFDPLEQFSIEIYNSYLFNSIGVCNSTSLSKIIIFNFLFVIFCVYSNKNFFFQNKFQKIVIFLFNFIAGILKSNLSVKKYSFILLIYTIFLFIFISNILGMIPYSITITSHLILTLYFSLSFFIGNNIIGLCFHQEKLFVLFLPEGVPLVLIPLMILIEYVSYISRIFSLAIRLFANMMSGHILLKILISFIWGILTSNLIH
jgi:ATP synthase subunit 6